MEITNMFVTTFAICLLVSSLTVAVIMLARRIFKKQLSAKGQYYIWFLLMIALILPFTPVQSLPFDYSLDALDVNKSNGTSAPFTVKEKVQHTNWMQDNSISVNRSNLENINSLIACIWIAGMLVMTVMAGRALLEVRRIKRTTYRVKSKEVQYLFEQCKRQLNVTGYVVVGESRHVKSPMTFGIFRNYVVLPTNIDEWMTLDEIKYILLHELNHYKSKDIAANYLMVLFQIIYWFNPLVWLAFQKMRLDREIACDYAVLSSLEENCHRDYGMTIIHFVDKVSRQKNFILANQFHGSKKQIKSRIEQIVSYSKESKLLKCKSLAIFILLGLLIASQVPFVAAMANDNNRYDFKGEQVVYIDFSNHFTGYDGSFVLYDLEDDYYQIYNKEKSTTRVSPNSTYKIYSALFGLESNLISSENSTINWDGTQYPFASWNAEQNLSTAMKNSVTWYFQELDKKNQAGMIQSYLEEIHYGNTDMSGGMDQYWLESSLKIAPVEQVELLKAFYFNDFGFKEQNIKTVKNAIKLEEKDDKILSGKTGTGVVNGKEINGWFIGYVEKEENTYFFATNMENTDKASGNKAVEITLTILKEKGIY